MALSTPLASPSSSNRLKALPLRPLSNEAAVTGASADLWLRDTVLKVYLSELDYFLGFAEWSTTGLKALLTSNTGVKTCLEKETSIAFKIRHKLCPHAPDDYSTVQRS